ncbi:MAG: hypothetical protein LBG27_13810 [Spirochaetaceae bacterium]|nr:hypothetical protein [Spirochaetaceae bacterium]
MKMIDSEVLPLVKDAVNKLRYGCFSILNLDLPYYSGLTGPQARGFGKKFYDTVSKGVLNTDAFTVRPVIGARNPQMYEKVHEFQPNPDPTYPQETLLKDATVGQAMERVFEIFFDRVARRYAVPFVGVDGNSLKDSVEMPDTA